MHARTTLVTLAVTLLLLGTLLFLLPTPVAPPDGTTESTVDNHWIIENVRVFDGERLLPPATLVLRDGKVVAEGAGSDGQLQDGAQLLDGSGLVALPGLVDAHTHSYASARRDALRFGVTSLVDMFTSPAMLQDHQQRAAYDQTDEAALFSAGMLATAKGGHGTQFGVPVATLNGPQDALDWVSARQAEGSDFIKLVYMPESARLPSIDLATARAVIEAGHEQGMTVVAHISRHADAEALVEAGIDGLVHVFADQAVSAELLEKMVARDVFVIPTLAIIAMVDGRAPGKELLEDPHLSERLGPGQRGNLASDFGGQVPGFSIDLALRNVAAMHTAGIRILAGSDAPNPGTAHGATLHQELALLVEAGLSNEAALRSAGELVAERFDLAGRGRLNGGDRADLILVAGNPLSDITATRAIHSIFRNGFLIESEPAQAFDVTQIEPELGRFEESLDAPDGFIWSSTSDEMRGGGSKSTLKRIGEGAGGSAGALSVEATVEMGFPFPWAGTYFGLAEEGRVANLEAYDVIAFDVRGTPAQYRLMLFSAGSQGAPPTRFFDVSEQWQRHEVSLDMPGFELPLFTGMAFTAPTTVGTYRFEIDNVTLTNADTAEPSY